MLTGIRFDNRLLPGEASKAMSQSDMVAIQTTWPRVLREAGYWTVARGKIYHSEVPKGDKPAWDIPVRKKSTFEPLIRRQANRSGSISLPPESCLV
jgi:arylsulfatase A-like enzyme